MADPLASARPVEPRDSAYLAAEWDQVAEERDRSISAGREPSYDHVLTPELLRLAEHWLIMGDRVVDAGCGTGRFARDVAAAFPDCSITGVDPSERSIEIAREQPAPGNLSFESSTVEEFATQAEPHSVTLIIANMLLQNVSSLAAVLDACRGLLTPDGALVFAIPHPCFWPRHWQYEQQEWFRHDREIWIEAPFWPSMPGNGLTTTHTHRPLAQYVQAFTEAELILQEIAEPLAQDWPYPRFLFGRCRPRGMMWVQKRES